MSRFEDSCMKKGNLTEEAFDKVKEIWNTEPRSNQIEVDDDETECNEVFLLIDDE